MLGIHHVARIRRIRCQHGICPPPPHDFPPPPPPPDKIPYGKSSHQWDFSPPPLPTKIAHAVPILHMEICVGRRFAIEGEGLPYIIPPPPREVLPSDFFRGEVCHMVVPPPPPLGKFCYGISSGGRFAIRYSFMGNVCHMV